MNKKNNPFPSARCEARDIQTEGKAVEFGYVEREHTGFTLIQDALVPESFIERVLYQMGSTYYSYGTVLKKEDMFFEKFLDSLTPAEHEVLMSVVLELMARGEFPLNISPETDLAKESRCPARFYGI